MRASTHLLWGFLCALVVDVFVSFPSILYHAAFYALVAFASLLPDIDYGGSTLGSHAKWIGFFVGHRGIFHSIWALAGFSLLAYIIKPVFWLPVAIGYASHLLADAANTAGILFFYPFGKKVRGPVKNGSVAEVVLFFFLLLMDVGLIMLQTRVL